MSSFINVSLNPTYYCNFRCNFCYLTEEQLSSTVKLDLKRFEEMVEELTSRYDEIGHVDIYGGEVMLLPPLYLNQIRKTLHNYNITDIVIITNLSVMNDIIHDKDFQISVSFDFSAREKEDLVFQNMMLMTREFSVLTLASREFLDTVTPDEYVQFMNAIPLLSGCEIKPYSSNQANAQDVKFSEFEEFVWAVVTHPDRAFYFENETQIKEAAEGKRNAFSDDHIYITPTGKYAVLEFDSNDNEFFLELDSLDDYKEWTKLESSRVNGNETCSTCPYMGNCLSEHLRDVKTTEHSCNGFKGLIDLWREDDGS